MERLDRYALQDEEDHAEAVRYLGASIQREKEEAGNVKFSHELIDRIKERVDLAELIGEHVTLKQTGDRYWGCCPFHEEKKPSFSVKPTEGFFYCFGCHVHGDALEFVQRIRGVGFMDAVRELAEKAGVDVEWEKDKGLADRIREAEYVDGPKPKPRLRDLVQDLNYETMDESRYVLYGREPAKYFMEKRGLTEETCRAWNLGDDTFMQRALIPIRDCDGYLVGVTGRYYGTEEKPKYLHSQGLRSGLFLFGEHMIDRTVETAILVESHMSVVKLWQHGYPNVLATMGSKASEVQVKKVVAWFNRVWLLVDGDNPGLNWLVAWRAGIKDRIQAVSKKCPDGRDPEDVGLETLVRWMGSPPGVNKGIVTRPKGFQGTQQRLAWS